MDLSPKWYYSEFRNSFLNNLDLKKQERCDKEDFFFRPIDHWHGFQPQAICWLHHPAASDANLLLHGNCSNTAEQTDSPSSQITFFLLLPISASQRGGLEVSCGSAGCCGKGRQMGTFLLPYLYLSKKHTHQITSGDVRGTPVVIYPICLRLWGGLSADLPL